MALALVSPENERRVVMVKCEGLLSYGRCTTLSHPRIFYALLTVSWGKNKTCTCRSYLQALRNYPGF
jgi:hypothetical protein